MAITTARDIVKAALRKISVLGVGTQLSAEEAQDAFDELNNMISDWSIEGDMIYSETRETFNLVESQASYTIGSGLDFNTSKPVYISAAYVTSGGNDYILNPIDRDQYAAKNQKDIGSIPDEYYYDDGYPTATIFLYPAPVNTPTITIYSDKALSEFATLDTSYAMPAYYRSALVYGLALRMAPEYEKEASATVKQQARKSKKNIKMQNTRNNKYLSTMSIPTSSTQGAVDRNAFISGK